MIVIGRAGKNWLLRSLKLLHVRQAAGGSNKGLRVSSGCTSRDVPDPRGFAGFLTGTLSGLLSGLRAMI